MFRTKRLSTNVQTTINHSLASLGIDPTKKLYAKALGTQSARQFTNNHIRYIPCVQSIQLTQHEVQNFQNWQNLWNSLLGDKN